MPSRHVLSRISFLNKLRDRLVSLAEDLFIWQENDAGMVCPGLLAETGAMHYQHMFLYQEFFDENVVAFGDVQSRKSIERAARRNATHSWRGVAPLDGQIAAGAKFLARFDQMMLGAFERCFDRVLFGMVGAQTRPQQAVNAF